MLEHFHGFLQKKYSLQVQAHLIKKKHYRFTQHPIYFPFNLFRFCFSGFGPPDIWHPAKQHILQLLSLWEMS